MSKFNLARRRILARARNNLLGVWIGIVLGSIGIFSFSRPALVGSEVFPNLVNQALPELAVSLLLTGFSLHLRQL